MSDSEKNIQLVVDKIIEKLGTSTDKVIPVLQAIQNEYSYLPEEALRRVCEKTEIVPSSIYGIATFYSQFRLKPIGKHLIKICIGTACHVKGAMLVYDAFVRQLQLPEGEDTDKDKLFTIEKVACLGCCTLAPVVQIDGKTYGHVEGEKVGEVIEDFLSSLHLPSDRKSPAAKTAGESQGEIRIGLGSCCVASGSADVKMELEKTLLRNNIRVDVKQVGCVGICNQVPIMEIHKPGELPSFYARIKPDEVEQVIRQHFKSTSGFDRIRNRLYGFFDHIAADEIPRFVKLYPSDRPDTPVAEFLNGQVSIATEHRGVIKPTDLGEYKSKGGFKALLKCLRNSTPEEVIAIIKESGLRGRGGAGFSTGTKWKLVKDPGAFMDRMLLESYPFRIIEGMLIAAYAVGAGEGLFYIRAEYPLAVKRIQEAISICENEGLLGRNIFNSNFSFNLRIFEGAGAFVCGEETALIASVEGKRGLPVLRPPYPAAKGLWGKPTLINNVETFSVVSWIIRNGASEFNKLGTENSKGTKVFALAGKIKRGGLIEVPMGISIRRIVEEIGGGIPDNKKFKAIQIGGPSGGCIPASLSDTPIDYISLTNAGAMMGSGGLVVLDETDCMVDIARYFLSFTQNQSCGRCTFCRVGTRRMLEILNKITSGTGTAEDLLLLEELAGQTKKGSICGLGKTAPNPVLSTLRYFREEYISHINGVCPTGKCKNMIRYTITEDCIGCTKCAQRCPSGAIEIKPYELHKVEQEKCIKCDICKQVCPVNAVITI
jgi:NADH-quinone oxidoreductase subunit F